MADATETAAQQVVDVSSAAPVMAAPPDLGMIWLAYIGLAVVFLAVLFWWIRRWPKWALVPFWSAFAAGALTPAAIGGDSELSAPAAIVAILGAEQLGMAGFLRGALPILISFVALTLMLSGLFWWLAQRQQRQASPKSELAETAEAEESGSASRSEPQL
ncbi:hypothetical protein [Permianibacter aggregans]|uniref:Uncharacterized protein n=1 Tax=Permianibacter aggregans TaxID=1510150 RepID=A0A4R6UX46_9GAMM|nr:hypothetical protein [Permianibacter aggregans]QGX38766.1 hypothetical protein E2H98_03460 [Permianibacter aggregans]TDQ50569.1 hypothetical protein EV696_102252 [Permianibacter aggregans]